MLHSHIVPHSIFDPDNPYDVAISVARPDRGFAEKVVHACKAIGLKVFYDKDEGTRLAGVRRAAVAEVYARGCRFAAVFVSKHYEASPWTSEEFRAAIGRPDRNAEACLLAVYLDDTRPPGLEDTVAFVWDDRLPGQIADEIAGRLGRPNRREVRRRWVEARTLARATLSLEWRAMLDSLPSYGKGMSVPMIILGFRISGHKSSPKEVEATLADLRTRGLVYEGVPGSWCRFVPPSD